LQYTFLTRYFTCTTAVSHTLNDKHITHTNYTKQAIVLNTDKKLCYGKV